MCQAPSVPRAGSPPPCSNGSSSDCRFHFRGGGEEEEVAGSQNLTSRPTGELRRCSQRPPPAGSGRLVMTERPIDITPQLRLFALCAAPLVPSLFHCWSSAKLEDHGKTMDTCSLHLHCWSIIIRARQEEAPNFLHLARSEQSQEAGV